MLLLTGATGTIGAPLLRLLTAAGVPTRCLVRDPRRLESERVRVQIAMGDLSDHSSFRHALRGIDTVVHLASVIRDQPGYSIEELVTLATWRLLRAAEHAGVRRFVYFSALGASAISPARLLRAKAVAEHAVEYSSLEHTIFAPSVTYAPTDQYLTLLKRMALAPVVPLIGAGRGQFQPITAEDVAACVMATLPGGAHVDTARNARFELAGPEILDQRQIVTLTLEALRRPRPLIPLPQGLVRRSLKLTERLLGEAAFATWDEAQLMTIPSLSARGSADVESLGITPASMATALGIAAA
jgi:uncharacterized protein YbjT (DUF2867 family)